MEIETCLAADNTETLNKKALKNMQTEQETLQKELE